jgi:AmpD protein
MKINRHWLSQASKVPSPNYDERPIAGAMSLLVIHCISLPPEKFGSDHIDQFFCNRLNPDEHPYFKEIHQLRVSSHLLIKRTGETVQYVPFNKRAWHAGLSDYKGQDKCNDFSIGIELEGSETQPYTDEQYDQLIAVSKALIEYYPELSDQHIVRHSDISPGRKTDPGESFRWSRFISAVKGG